MTKTIPTRILAIDHGAARIGLAISDERKIIATPLPTLLAEKKTEATITKLLQILEAYQQEHHCSLEAIIVGMPLKMNGKIGLQADEVQHFMDVLSSKTSIPIIPWDERLTTVLAERSLRESNMSRKKRSKVIDSVASVLILQSYLDLLGGR